jgi:hypothetical protein
LTESRIGGALQFNGDYYPGVNAIVDIGSTVTISAWAKSDTSTPASMLWTLGNNNDNNGPALCFLNLDGGKIALNIGQYHGNDFCDLPADLDKWHLYTTVLDASDGPKGSAKLYIDGKLANSATELYPVEYKNPTSHEFHVSARYYLNAWQGAIDDVQVFNRALTASEVALLYGAPIPPIPGDCNGDGKVNIFDIIILGKAFGSNTTSPNWDARADMNNDGKVDVFDLVIIARHFGEGT